RREPALHRPLEQAPAGFGRLAGGAERPAAGHVLQHDPAAALGIALSQETQRGLDALGVVVRRLGELVDRQRLRGHDQQRLDGSSQPVDRARGDQAERAVHSSLLSSAALLTRIGANGAAWSSATSPPRRSSSSARRASACSILDIPSISASRSKTLRRRNTARKRSRNCPTGAKRSSRSASETSGGASATARGARPSASGSCGATLRSTRGARGAGPSRKK